MTVMRSWTTGRVVACVAASMCLWVARAEAAQTVEVTMNGHRHTVAFPDGWRASPEDGGVFLQPPAGRNDGVQVVVVGVPTPASSVTALQMAKNIAEGDLKKKPYLIYSTPSDFKFVGEAGALVKVEGVNPDSKTRELTIYVMAMKGDTTYLLQAQGGYDQLMTVIDDVNTIANGVQMLSGAAPAPSAPQKDAPPPPPTEPLWTKDAPLPAPPAGAKFLVNDAMLGVTVDRLEGWGVSAGMNNYAIEHRLSGSARVVASIWLGTDKFTGSGNQYMKKVAGDANARWDRFGQQDALLIERPPQFAGAGDVLEIHVLRGETPIVFSLRYDGGSWKDRNGKEVLAELDGATRVGDPGKARGGLVVVGNLAKVKPGKGWAFDGYGPGALATWKKGDVSARVAVFSRGAVPPARCQGDQTKPATATTKLSGKDASGYVCPKDAADQLVYTVPVGELVVYLSFTDASSEHSPGKAAAEFGRFVKF
jgi:hypothetical protein